ncbi:hypothetical protein, partial [Salmonella enterica]|uniref:hypothetical protein n=1 Tax=Salmonella enterica TaxID=28901 RepID=UPI001ABFD4D9
HELQMKFEYSQRSHIFVSGHPGESGDVYNTRNYLYPFDLIRFVRFFDMHSFWGLIGDSLFVE